jgi:hypothetical protein
MGGGRLFGESRTPPKSIVGGPASRGSIGDGGAEESEARSSTDSVGRSRLFRRPDVFRRVVIGLGIGCIARVQKGKVRAGAVESFRWWWGRAAATVDSTGTKFVGRDGIFPNDEKKRNELDSD